MMTIRFKKGRIPFEKLQELLESGLEGDETQLHLESAKKMKLD